VIPSILIRYILIHPATIDMDAARSSQDADVLDVKV
jgi:hypothetical protein